MESVSRSARMEIKNPNLIQLYSAATPNGIKVAAALEEIIELRSRKGEEFDYEPHTVNIRTGESRKPDFLKFCPNGKIPVIYDPHGPGGKPVTQWESGAILLYLAEKFNVLIPSEDLTLRAEVVKWLFWGSVSISTQAKTFGFYHTYCTHKMPYCTARFAREVDRLLLVLEGQLQHEEHWIVGDVFTIADISIWPWVHALHTNYGNAIHEWFNDCKDYPLVRAWYLRCIARPASRRAFDVTPFFQ